MISIVSPETLHGPNEKISGVDSGLIITPIGGVGVLEWGIMGFRISLFKIECSFRN